MAEVPITLLGTPVEAQIRAREQQKQRDQETAFQRRLQMTREERERDIERGRELGQELIGEGSLRRLEEGRSAEIADIIERRRAQLEGFTPEEQQAMREQILGEITPGEQTALRQLRGIQGAQGIRGGLAAAQQAEILAQGQQARTQAERDLFLQQVAERRRALEALEASTVGAREEELARQRFNIGQQQAEKFGQISTTFGVAGLGSQERGAIRQELIGQAEAEAAQAAAAQDQGKK